MSIFTLLQAKHKLLQLLHLLQGVPQAMRKLMRDHGKEGAVPRDDFKALLASGALSPAMRQFLTSTLGQTNLLWPALA